MGTFPFLDPPRTRKSTIYDITTAKLNNFHHGTLRFSARNQCVSTYRLSHRVFIETSVTIGLNSAKEAFLWTIIMARDVLSL
jgi:hypothetical protein